MREAVIILKQCALRHWRSAWRQQALLLLILALGTAVHVAMRMANSSALAGFRSFTDTVTRDFDWTVRAPAGSIKMGWLEEMRAALDLRPVALIPVIEATVVPADHAQGTIGSRPTWRLVGMDFISLASLASSGGIAPNVVPDGSATAEERVFASDAMARRQGWSEGSYFELVLNDKVVRVKLAGVLPTLPDQPAPPDHMLLMDLPRAQAIMARDGEVDRVEVIAKDGRAFPTLRDDARSVLETAALGRWQLLGHEDKQALAGGMTAAFRLNLNILSLLALLVGGYLVFQALDGVVIRRRGEIAVLRSLGVTERSIQWAFLLEAAVLGIVAGVIGVLMGWMGAQLAVRGVSATMTALYGASSATYADLSVSEVLLGCTLSVVTSLAAAWWPARQAARTPPAQALGHHAVSWQGGRVWKSAWLGLILMLVAVALAQLPAWRLQALRLPLGAYASALLWLLGGSLISGMVLKVFRHSGSALRATAFSYLRAPSVRHRFAAAALTSAMAMTTGMAVMIASFDHTMRGWIMRSMQADVYASSAGAQSASSTHQISEETVDALRVQPEVAELATVQYAVVQLPDGPSSILGSDMDFAQRHRLHAWVESPPDDWWKTENAVGCINESLSTRLGCKVGDTLRFPTPQGEKEVKVAGIYADYGNERGSLLVAQELFHVWFGHKMAWRIAMMLKSGADAQAVTVRMQQAHPGLSLFTQAHLRSEALRIFRQTFAVTYSLEAVGVVVAVAGLGLALAGLMLDRRADLTTLRALGFSRRDLAAVCAWEGLGLGLAGVLTGGVSGVWLGWLLIARVNKQSFGWTLSWSLPWGQILLLGSAVLLTGVVVAAAVGRWSSQLKSEQEE